MPRAGQKYLDLIEQRFAIAFDVTVVYSRKLDELRARNALGHIARIGDVDHALRGTVQNERWDPNGGQYLAHVDVAVHFHDRDRRAGACRCAEIGSPAFGTLGIAGEARSVHGDRYALRRSPMTLEIIEHALPLLVLPAKWIIRAPGALGVGAVQDQRRGPRRVCRGIKERHRSTLGHSEQCRSFRSDFVENGLHVVHALFEREDLRAAVGHARAAFVKKDDSAERGEALEKCPLAG